MAKNNVRGHAENPGESGFLAADPSSRLGKPWDSGVGVLGKIHKRQRIFFSNDREAVHLIFDAPYHRVPFIQPRRTSVWLTWLSADGEEGGRT